MVDGIHGYMSHAARHVVVEYVTTLENATIPDHHVVGITALVKVSARRNAMIIAVQVHNLIAQYMYMYECL